MLTITNHGYTPYTRRIALDSTAACWIVIDSNYALQMSQSTSRIYIQAGEYDNDGKFVHRFGKTNWPIFSILRGTTQ